jgi:molybdopterin molybdotransferase
VALRHALGRTLTEEIVAAEQVPPFDNAAMDGYAVRSEDLPASLRIVGELASGDVPAIPLRTGEAMAIMTGAMVPAGCTAVVQQEWTDVRGDGTVTINKTVPPGHNIRTAGSDIPRGKSIVPSGTLLRPQELGVLASLGKEFVTVARRPEVAILTTGSELVDLRRPLPPGKIRNSNLYVLSALVEEAGGEPRELGIAKDDPAEIRAKLADGLRADLLVTSGGVSVGKFDLVPTLLAESGVRIHFSKVNIKPGMPLLFGTFGATAVFGLPGNPVSGMVTFLQFVRPALSMMLGRAASAERISLRARMEHEIVKHDGKRHYVRGVLSHRDGILTVRSTGSQVSNILTSLARANCLIILPETLERVRAEDEVEVELL